MNTSPIIHRDGTYRGAIALVTDVTDRRAHLERQDAIAELGRDVLRETSLEVVVESATNLINRMVHTGECRIISSLDANDAREPSSPITRIAAGTGPAGGSSPPRLRVPIGDPQRPFAHIEVATQSPATRADLEFVEGVAGILLSSIVRTQAVDAIRHQAMHDPLTGLPNRTLFNDRLAHALSRRARIGGYVAVMVVDLDGFKNVNDSLGHLTGDALLIAVADRFDEQLRDLDTIARLGGDEFAILVDDLDAPDQAGRVALPSPRRAPHPAPASRPCGRDRCEHRHRARRSGRHQRRSPPQQCRRGDVSSQARRKGLLPRVRSRDAHRGRRAHEPRTGVAERAITADALCRPLPTRRRHPDRRCRLVRGARPLVAPDSRASSSRTRSSRSPRSPASSSISVAPCCSQACHQARQWQRDALNSSRASPSTHHDSSSRHPSFVEHVADALDQRRARGHGAHPRDHRISARRRVRSHHRNPRRAAPHRGARRDRRLRHRLLVVRRPRRAPDRHPQDRQAIHRQHRSRRQGPRIRQRHHAARAARCNSRPSPKASNTPSSSRRSPNWDARNIQGYLFSPPIPPDQTLAYLERHRTRVSSVT